MTISLHRLSIPVFRRGLDTLTTYLDKAEAFAAETGRDPAEIVSARLAPDMLPFSGQYQRASDSAKFAVGRITGLDMPRFEDDEQSIAELRARVAKTQAFLAAVPDSTVDQNAERIVSIKVGGVPMEFAAADYLLNFALPNFYFHVTTAHAILRHLGAPVGKRDFLGPLP